MSDGLSFPPSAGGGVSAAAILAAINPAPSVQTGVSGAKTLAFVASALQTQFDLTMSGATSLTIDAANAQPGMTMVVTLRGAYAWSFTGTPSYPNGLVPVAQCSATAFDKLQIVVEADGSLSILPVVLGASKPTITVQSVSPLFAASSATISGVYVGMNPANLDYSFDGGAFTTLASGAVTLSNGTFSFSTALPAGVGAHTVQVRSTGSGLTSAPFSLTTLAGQPAAGVVATAGAGNAAVSLIMAATAQGQAISSFQIGRGTSATGPFTNVGSATPASAPATGATSAAYNDTTPVNGTAYYYQVTAVTSGGSTAGSAIGPYTPNANGNLPTHYLAADASHSLYMTGGAGGSAFTANDYIDLAVLSAPTNLANQNVLATDWAPGTVNQTNGVYFYQLAPGGVPKASVVNRAGAITEFTASTGLTALGVTIPPGGIWSRIQVNGSSAAVTPTAPTVLGAGPTASIPAATGVHSVSLDGKNWVQLGAPLTGGTGGSGNGSGGIAVPTTTNYFNVGTYNSTNTFIGKIFKQIAVDLNARLITNPDPTIQATGTTSFNDTASTPNAWSANAGGII